MILGSSVIIHAPLPSLRKCVQHKRKEFEGNCNSVSNRCDVFILKDYKSARGSRICQNLTQLIVRLLH